MLYAFPAGTHGMVRSDYDRPYENSISVRKGEIVRPVTDGSMETDIMGWTWCVGPDDLGGWVPDSWCEITDEGRRLLRDFDARELTVRTGQRLRLIFSESGFIFAETADGDRAWIPDAVMELERTDMH